MEERYMVVSRTHAVVPDGHDQTDQFIVEIDSYDNIAHFLGDESFTIEDETENTLIVETNVRPYTIKYDILKRFTIQGLIESKESLTN